MALVIDALENIKNKIGLPTEAFFVDTNIIINFKDPFGASLGDKTLQKINEEVSSVLIYLKSNYKVYTTLSVAIELYNYFRYRSYLIYKKTDKFDTFDFKKLRENDVGFMSFWDNYLKMYKKLLTKNFQLINDNLNCEKIFEEFRGSCVDFGDHLLFKSAIINEKNNSIFSNDIDFYSYKDVFYLITTNKTILSKAKSDNKLYKKKK